MLYPLISYLFYPLSHFLLPRNKIGNKLWLSISILFIQTALLSSKNYQQPSFEPLLLWPFGGIHLNEIKLTKSSSI